MIAGGIAVRPDLLFPRLKIAVFVDGCFWTNTEYWAPKLQRNRARDQLVSAALGDTGWVVIRIWEHEDPGRAAAVIRQAVRERAASAC
jgi:DNA mismatch endonuclease (patch repair protein)